jgi:hypothetical protein
MNECFSAAAAKHLDDGDLLSQRQRWDNTAYLAGYVVECSLKCVLGAAGLPPVRFGHDIKSMTYRALSLGLLLSPAACRYTPPGTPEFADIMANWVPDLRYGPAGSVTATQASAWLRAAHGVYQETVVAAILDGLEDKP